MGWEREREREGEGEGEVITLVGRKVPMTSEVFWVSCGPPGGGGGTTRGPAIVSVLTQKWKVQLFYQEFKLPMVQIDEVLSLRKTGL